MPDLRQTYDVLVAGGGNAALCAAIKEDGRVYLSPAQIDGKTWLRPCFTNFRTDMSDVDALFEVIDELGTKLAGV